MALPPLSPLRAPATVPSGTRRVGPSCSADGVSTGSSGCCGSGGPSADGTTSTSPPGRTTVCGTSRPATHAGAYTPYGTAAGGALVVEKPGMLASASSTSGAVNALPTRSRSGSLTVTCSRALASSSVGASAVPVRASTTRASATASSTGASWRCSSAALRSTSRPVSGIVTLLR